MDSLKSGINEPPAGRSDTEVILQIEKLALVQAWAEAA
jgi:hypothetical protein